MNDAQAARPDHGHRTGRMSAPEIRQIALTLVTAAAIITIGVELKIYIWSPTGIYAPATTQQFLINVIVGGLSGFVLIVALAGNIVRNLTTLAKSRTGKMAQLILAVLYAAALVWTIYQAYEVAG